MAMEEIEDRREPRPWGLILLTLAVIAAIIGSLYLVLSGAIIMADAEQQPQIFTSPSQMPESAAPSFVPIAPNRDLHLKSMDYIMGQPVKEDARYFYQVVFDQGFGDIYDGDGDIPRYEDKHWAIVTLVDNTEDSLTQFMAYVW